MVDQINIKTSSIYLCTPALDVDHQVTGSCGLIFDRVGSLVIASVNFIRLDFF